jgi:hypothetical protein
MIETRGNNRKMAKRDQLVVLDPTIEPAEGGLELAGRLPALEGKVVGLLDNSKPNSDKILSHVGNILRDRYRAAELIIVSKNDASTSAPTEILDMLVRRCHCMVTGIGD